MSSTVPPLDQPGEQPDNDDEVKDTFRFFVAVTPYVDNIQQFLNKLQMAIAARLIPPASNINFNGVTTVQDVIDVYLRYFSAKTGMSIEYNQLRGNPEQLVQLVALLNDENLHPFYTVFNPRRMHYPLFSVRMERANKLRRILPRRVPDAIPQPFE